MTRAPALRKDAAALSKKLTGTVPSSAAWKAGSDAHGVLWEHGTVHCWDGWGNSYLMPWFTNWWRVAFVGGHRLLGAPIDYPPTKGSRVAVRPTTKLILGDWNWDKLRDPKDPRTLWHHPPGKRVMPMLFGDNHAADFTFPPTWDNGTGSWFDPADMNGNLNFW